MPSCVGGGSVATAASARFENFSQLALRKFQRLTGLVGTGSIGLAGTMRDGLCWDFGKGSKITQ